MQKKGARFFRKMGLISNPVMDRDTMLFLFYGKTGNFAFFNELYKRYAPMINGLLFQMGLIEKFEREELLQQVFLKIVEKRDSFIPKARFSTWLYKIAYNTALNYLRNRKYRQGSESQPEIGGGTDPLEELVKQERKKYVLKAVQRLGSRQREAIILRDFLNISYADIGEIMNISLSAVESLLFHARQNLKNGLKGVFCDR